ncbi:MAG: transcriptional regulator [Lentisphaerae bacterium RIFOXYC12_FULL_60_16]|nr:MAG: transcriptional regulator [Lentisphaerae bacterium RIFOXYC12_FULL_60_16]OGV69950.1 MAG: transcriptional regulator [Lentisphaerae bacterium RIFOXYA12_FULL_60_10]OGV84340.1 MAG: transcriptional regulator [Lentisphaerae bacterium RIFOXYB12_FULL_60_10]
MKEGDVILTPLPQADGATKSRPALLLRELPPFGDYLACGISTQLHRAVPEFDDIISKDDTDFTDSGLLSSSVIRLGFLAVLPNQRIVGTIGQVASDRHTRLLKTLSKHLVANLEESANKAIDSDKE